jgi:hypothetical protein
MFCTKCGTSLENDDLFCHECGQKVNDSQFVNNSIYHSSNNELSVQRSYAPSVWNRPEITKVLIVGNDSRKSASSSIIRGAIGGTMLGPIGLFGGLISGKNRNKTTFLIFFSNGAKKTVTCKTNGLEFNFYIKYVQ